MSPTEHETQVAIEAAAERLWSQSRNQIMANTSGAVPAWGDLEQSVRNYYLDCVNPLVWAALQALPDRLEPVRVLMQSGIPDLEDWDLISRYLDGVPR